MTRVLPSRRLIGTIAFTALALLPSITQLSSLTIPVTNPLLAVGPLLAGFGLAARFAQAGFGFFPLGVVVTGLIWITNWLMMADGNCCSPVGH